MLMSGRGIIMSYDKSDWAYHGLAFNGNFYAYRLLTVCVICVS